MIVVGEDGWGRCGHHHRHLFLQGRAVCNREIRSGRAALETSNEVVRADDCKHCRRILIPEPRVVTVVSLGRLNEDLLDRIHGMLQRGELTHAPPDYWTERKKLERRRAAARRRRKRLIHLI